MLFITNLKVSVEMNFQIQGLICNATGHVKWLGMIKELHAAIG